MQLDIHHPPPPTRNTVNPITSIADQRSWQHHRTINLPRSSRQEIMDEVKGTRWCAGCRKQVNRSEFSKNQLKKGNGAKCKQCVGGSSNTSDRPSTSIQEQSTEPTPVILSPRPQRAVPGFDGLTVCRDWPQTKNGRPPNAQSLIFNPLLACSLGQPIDGHCTEQQLNLAVQWWSLALPSWPQWMEALRIVLATEDLRERLFRTAKGRPNALIPKTKGRGTAPHFNGRLQEEILELAPTTALEVYASVTCLYSAAALDETEGQET